MQSVVLVSCLILAAVFMLAHSAPMDDELGEYNKSLDMAKKAVMEAKTTLKSDYIQNFATIMYKGVEELDKTTQEKLKTIKDKVERARVIEYATKAYVRLVDFLQEVKQSLE